MDNTIDKAKAYLQTILAGEEKSTFTRDELCKLIIQAYSDGYDEGAYDFGDKVTSNPFFDYFPNPLTSIQADKLARQFQDISKICDNSTTKNEIMEMLLADIRLLQEERLPSNLSDMVEYWGDKLIQIRLKNNTNGQQSNS